MSLQPQKCQLLHITRKKSPVKASYTTNGHTLTKADTGKYTGVSLHKHTSSPHAHQTEKKAKTCASLQHNLHRAPTAMNKCTCESLVWPILEYSSVVWDPHTTVTTLEVKGCTGSVPQCWSGLAWNLYRNSKRRPKASFCIQFG